MRFLLSDASEGAANERRAAITPWWLVSMRFSIPSSRRSCLSTLGARASRSLRSDVMAGACGI